MGGVGGGGVSPPKICEKYHFVGKLDMVVGKLDIFVDDLMLVGKLDMLVGEFHMLVGLSAKRKGTKTKMKKNGSSRYLNWFQWHIPFHLE